MSQRIKKLAEKEIINSKLLMTILIAIVFIIVGWVGYKYLLENSKTEPMVSYSAVSRFYSEYEDDYTQPSGSVLEWSDSVKVGELIPLRYFATLRGKDTASLMLNSVDQDEYTFTYSTTCKDSTSTETSEIIKIRKGEEFEVSSCTQFEEVLFWKIIISE